MANKADLNPFVLAIAEACGYQTLETATNKDALHYLSTLEPDELNSFISIIGKTVKQRVFSTSFERADNKFAEFFIEELPYGMSMEDLFVNMKAGTDIDFTGSTVDDRMTPDIKPTYHTLNYQKSHSDTTTKVQMQTAFLSEEGITAVAERIIASITSSAEWGLYLQCLELLSTMVMQKNLVLKATKPLSSEANIKVFLKDLKAVVRSMKTVSKSNNASGVYARTKPEDIIVIMPGKNIDAITVDYLAGVFNVDKVEMQNRIIEVEDTDGFGSIISDSHVLALVIDKRMFVAYPNYQEMSSRYNEQGSFWNHFFKWLWTFSYSPFFNGVALVDDTADWVTVADDANITTKTPADAAVVACNPGDELKAVLDGVTLQWTTHKVEIWAQKSIGGVLTDVYKYATLTSAADTYDAPPCDYIHAKAVAL